MPAKTATRPSILVSETDADRLFLLIEQRQGPADCSGLRAELERAQVRPDHLVPASVVGMNSTVDFLDEAHGATRTVQLVYPGQADIAAGRVSVLSPVGAGLIGLKAGQSIQWPDRDGRLRALRVLKVSRGQVV
ncbi:nucleoside diphosphate kinase regulator [Phenylobacterium sp.]|uniref:nucleoside diphosphate kinase regulator n=1 Tax=Phenylobacterium sp. TaxID=1871053 RepID=UPI0030F3E2EE